MTSSISKKKIISNIVMLFSATSIGQVAAGLSILFTARPLGTDAFGQYSACFALTRMTSIVFALGMDTWLLREGRRGEVSLGKLVGSNLTIKTILGCVWLTGLAITSRFLNPNTYPPNLLFMSARATWLEATLQTVSYSYIISLRNQVTVALEISSSLGLLLSTLILVFLQVTDPMIYVLVRLIIAGVATLSGLLWFRRISPLSADLRVTRMTLSSILPFALSDAMVLIYTSADITIVAMILGEQAAGF